jgi:hypothetical protein
MEPLVGDPWVFCEADVPASAKERLGAAGFRIEATDPNDRSLGHAMLLRLDGDEFRAASDPRSDVGALAS